jgi:hypothetical protein
MVARASNIERFQSIILKLNFFLLQKSMKEKNKILGTFIHN